MASDRIVYIGPLNKALNLHPHVVLLGGVPAHVQAAMDASPAFANQFVDFDKWAKGRPPGAIGAKPKTQVAAKQPTPIRKKS